jgi:hypothetical protein
MTARLDSVVTMFIWQEGNAARRDGVLRADNPHVDNPIARAAWFAGWDGDVGPSAKPAANTPSNPPKAG